MQHDPVETTEACYRHPTQSTRVHCTRCGRPICPDCMIPAPVGFQCPECVQLARREFRQARPGVARLGLGQGRLTATNLLLLAMGVMFVVEILAGGPNAALDGPTGQRLYDLGALYPPAIASGQYWRLFSAMFLHLGLIHIAFNAYALWLFGQFAERTFGSLVFLLIFFVTGFLASATSYAFGPPLILGAGASGAIFGVFGAFVAYNYRRRHLAMAAANLRWAVMLIVLNAVLAFGWSGIDWRAHVGGLLAGFAAGFVAEGVGSDQVRRLVRILGFAALIGVGVALVMTRTADLRSLMGP
ncbi:MAG TPA: rhomboid family intramembrane serine protease [Actinomycetota bacterium]|nr:rhomboid family intramembrane serine protease [Actinomycetota bacterium]